MLNENYLRPNFLWPRALARRSCASVFAAALLTLIAPRAAQAGELERILNDTKDYVTAPLRWNTNDWEWFAGSLAVTALASTADESVRSHFAPGPATGQHASHELRDAAPLALLTAGTYLVSRFGSDDNMKRTSFDMAEAGVLAILSASAFKYIAGRTRPFETTQSNQWFKSGDGFPSGHTSAAFAVATVFAEQGPNPTLARRALAYGLAGATAYARLDGNSHWLSDVVGGAALGIATGRFMLHRQSKASASQFNLVPTDGGAMLTWTMQPR